MSRTLPTGRVLMTANEAAAHAVVLARVRAIASYPITPQTIIVERLADLVAGRDDVEYANLESEHSMFGWAIAASHAGVRTFTATSSQGLLYAHEQLHRAARERVPLVAVNVNRSIFAPWSLEPDLSDSMSQRDTGWIQLYCSRVQEVFDDVLYGYRIAETLMLPVMVCAEGFLLSHTSELLELPDQETVDGFLPDLSPPDEWLLDPARPRVFSGLPQPTDYAAFQSEVAKAHDRARGIIEVTAAEFGARFGRPKVGALEIAGDADADTALITIGTIGDTAQELLEDDDDLLLVRVHAFRPFPADELAAVLSTVSNVAVVDRAAAFGSFAPLGGDVRSLDLRHADVVDFVAGVGGTDVTPATLRWAVDEARSGGRDSREAGTRVRPGGGVAMAAWLDEVVSEERLLLPGHSACAGCGPAINMRHVLGALAAATPGSRIVLVIPASCWTIVAGVWPVSTFGVTVHLTPFASAAAEACGIKAALRLRGLDKTHVVVWGGDGATSDIGFSGVSAAAERNEDILYVLNDNEAYMNTGVQKSGATPEGAWTTTTPAAAPRCGSEEGHPAHHGRARCSLRGDPGRGIGADAPRFQGQGGESGGARRLPLPARPRRLPAGLAVPHGPVGRDRAARRRVALLPPRRLRRRQLEHHLQAQAPGAGPDLPRIAGTLRPSLARADRDDPGSRRRALEPARPAGDTRALVGPERQSGAGTEVGLDGACGVNGCISSWPGWTTP